MNIYHRLRTRLPLKLILAASLALGAVSCASLHNSSAGDPVGPPCAQAYYQWLTNCLDGLQKDLPAITASAEPAAAAYLQDGWAIGIYADRDMVGEFSGRAGGLMGTVGPKAVEKPDWKGIVLFFPREQALQEDFATAREFIGQHKYVVGFGSPAVRQAAAKAHVPWAGFVDTHAAPHGGLFPAHGQWLVPTDPTANIAALWTWTGEFAGALTRRGKMPPFYQSISVPGSEKRNALYGGQKFLDQTPQEVPPGQIGSDYLTHLRDALATIRQQDMASILKVAAIAAATRQSGHQAHVFAHGHALDEDIGIPHDPGFLHQVNRGLFGLKADPGISKGDFVFCLGYDRIFEGWYFNDDLPRMRAAGASFAWSMTDYNKDPEFGPAAVPPGEIVIGQHWPLGDAVATVPGYDIKILPPSGVIGEAILWMTESQMLGILGPDAAAPAAK